MKKTLLTFVFSISLTVACGGKTIDSEDTSTTTVDTSISTAPYPECEAHSDCSEEQFCGVECWTGDCGVEEDILPDTRGQFCQPCVECESGEDSISGDCTVCD